MSGNTSLAAIVLTYNEELHIGRCLASISGLASELYVVDSGSSDNTVAIAAEHGAVVLYHPFRNQADQFRWALENIRTDADWIMRLDADEVVEPDLAERIANELPCLPSDVVGVNIDRKQIFMGRWIRYGGRYPLRLLRIFRRGHGRVEQRWMDEHIVVEGGRTVHFAGGFADHNLNGLSYFTNKHNQYATREAIDVLSQRLGLFERRDEDGHHMGSGQAAFRRWFKTKVYNRIPFIPATLGYFLLRYIGQFGFLDGKEGLIYHFLQAYWYRFLVGAKVLELERAIAGLRSPEEIVARLEQLTGQQLSQTTERAPTRSVVLSGRRHAAGG